MKQYPEIKGWKERSKGDFVCGCGGDLACEGTITRKLPIGFGFREGVKGFVVDCAIQHGYIGQCMDCGVEGSFGYGKAKLGTRRIKLQGAA